jgi:anti-anti-sigma factor
MTVMFSVASYDIEGGRVVAPNGELDISTCPALAGYLQAPPGDVLVVDLADLTFLDSSGLGLIHAARREACRTGGSLVVSRPTPSVRRVLEITGLDGWVAEWQPRWSRRRSVSSGATPWRA